MGKTALQGIISSEFITEKDIQIEQKIDKSSWWTKPALLLKYNPATDYLLTTSLRKDLIRLNKLLSKNEGKDITKPSDVHYSIAHIDRDYFNEVYTGTENHRYFLADEILNKLST